MLRRGEASPRMTNEKRVTPSVDGVELTNTIRLSRAFYLVYATIPAI